MYSAAFTPDGKRIVVGDESKKVSLLDAASGEVVWQKEMGGAVCRCTNILALRADCGLFILRDAAFLAGVERDFFVG